MTSTTWPSLFNDHLEDLADDVLDYYKRCHADEVVAAVAYSYEHDEYA